MNGGQAFTLEGVAASLLLIIATFTIFQSSVVSAPSWSELYNVQMRVLAFDILRTLDIREGNSSLKFMITHIRSDECSNDTCNIASTSPEFVDELTDLLNTISAYGRVEIAWIDSNGTLRDVTLQPFDSASVANAVRAERYVVIETSLFSENSPFHNLSKARTLQVFEVVLEVWK